MYYPRLKDLREDRDLVQKQIASFLGIDQRVYSIYETGKREIPTRFVIALAKYYNTSTDYILGLTNNPAPYTLSIDNKNVSKLFRDVFYYLKLLTCLFNSNCTSNSHTNHWVVTCTDKTHHLYMGRN